MRSDRSNPLVSTPPQIPNAFRDVGIPGDRLEYDVGNSLAHKTLADDGWGAKRVLSAVYRRVADGLSGRRGASLMAFAGASGL